MSLRDAFRALTDAIERLPPGERERTEALLTSFLDLATRHLSGYGGPKSRRRT